MRGYDNNNILSTPTTHRYIIQKRFIQTIPPRGDRRNQGANSERGGCCVSRGGDTRLVISANKGEMAATTTTERGGNALFPVPSI